MKLVSCLYADKTYLGVLGKQQNTLIIPALDKKWRGCNDMLELIDTGTKALEALRTYLSKDGSSKIPLPSVRLLSPIVRPRQNVLCLGWNYASHVAETAGTAVQSPPHPKHPVVFTKDVSTVNGPFDTIPYDKNVIRSLDWEAELAVIIGKPTYQAHPQTVLSHVFGYTVANDLTERGLQKRHSQFFLGKSLPGCCPMGPFIVTPDEINNIQKLHIKSWVNGVLKQNGNTSKQIFPVAETISRISYSMPLEPGTIIATGTPAGVGIGRTPPEFLSPGDLVECEVQNIGKISNRIAG